MRAEFFGEPWPSGICEDATQVETPVGVPCILCEVAIADGDRGSFSIPLGGDGTVRSPVHRECGLRAVSGGIAHISGSRDCPCRGGDDPDGGFTYRESAILVWNLLVGKPRAAIERELADTIERLTDAGEIADSPGRRRVLARVRARLRPRAVPRRKT
jgi:hypothetical protein